MIYIFLIYVFLVPFEYIQVRFPLGPTGINYANLMMVLMSLFWIFGRASSGRSLILKSPLNLVLLAFLGSTYFGILLSSMLYNEASSAIDISSPAVSHFLQFINAFLFFYFAANLINSRKHIRWMMLALAFAAPWVFRVFYSQLHSILVWHYNDNLRISGPFVYIGSNELGAFMLYSAVMLGLYAFLPRKPWQKIFFALASFCYIYGILYSFSRATQLGFLVCCMAVAALRYRWLLIVMVLMAVTSPAWLPASVSDRWAMTRSEDGELDSSAQSRENFWAEALTFWEESPLVGIGVGGFMIRGAAKMDTHNIYYRILCEQGLVGFSLFLLIWWLVLRMCYQLWKQAPHPDDRHYGFCLMIATLGMMVVNYFGDRYTHLAVVGQYWVLVGMAARLYANMTGAEPLDDDADEAAQWDRVPALMRAQPSAASVGLNIIRPAFSASLPTRSQSEGVHLFGLRGLSRFSGLLGRSGPKSNHGPQNTSSVSLNIVGKERRPSSGLDIVGRSPSPPRK